MKMRGRVSGPTGRYVTCVKDFSLPIPTAAARALGETWMRAADVPSPEGVMNHGSSACGAAAPAFM